jgi:hypothetical protein
MIPWCSAPSSFAVHWMTAISNCSNLPIPHTSLIGREQHLADAAALLLRPDVWLLTFTGPGGAGKTRLALALASAIADQFTAGVQFVSLASIRHPDLVATAMADALGIPKVANCPIAQLIGDRLQNSGPFLLLLDNFEQVLPESTVVPTENSVCPYRKCYPARMPLKSATLRG